jgi:hypothetical protein
MAAALSTAALQMQSPTDTLAARHLDRLTVMWQQAHDLYGEREYARCLDKLDELCRADPDYQEQKARQLRQQAVEQLVERANRALAAGDFSESLTAVKSLREREVNHPELDGVEAQARAGLDTLALQARLNKLYEEALVHLDNREYQLALAKWEAIEKRRENLAFPDKLAVVKRANEGICANLYSQAIAALAQKNPEQAMASWAQIAATDSNFPDPQGVVSSAQAMIQERERKSWRNPLLVLGSMVLLLLLVFGASNLLGNNGAGASDEEATAVPSSTALPAIAASTETATTAPTETTASPTATATPTNTAVPSNTPTPTATFTPSTTPLPENIAVVNENATIFAQADTEATEINVVMADETVAILGRSDNNNWFYVRDADGNVGFIFADLLTWEGDIASLPIRSGTVAAESTTTAPILSENLSLDIYQLDGTEVCSGSAWTQVIYMRAQGVSGTFEYYWEGELVGTAVNDNITFEISSNGGAIIGTGSVIVNGIIASKELFIPAPPCSD